MKVVVALLVALLAALQLRLWFGEGSVQELWRVREEARSSRAQVLALRARNQALRAEVADLKSGLEAIEERARTDLGMVDADETFYQFVRAPGAGAVDAGGGGADVGGDVGNAVGVSVGNDAGNAPGDTSGNDAGDVIGGTIGDDESGRTRRVE